jgi:hypothetical protein
VPTQLERGLPHLLVRADADPAQGAGRDALARTTTQSGDTRNRLLGRNDCCCRIDARGPESPGICEIPRRKCTGFIHAAAVEKEARMRLTIDWMIWIVRREAATTIASKLTVFLPAADGAACAENKIGRLLS